MLLPNTRATTLRVYHVRVEWALPTNRGLLSVATQALSEPDKRLSHIRLLSVSFRDGVRILQRGKASPLFDREATRTIRVP